MAGVDAGDPGLADPLAALYANWQYLVGSLGFNSPEKRNEMFSLRQELFRTSLGYQGNEVWKEVLERHVYPNIRDFPEIERYAKLTGFGAVEPGIVIEFETAVVRGCNFFNKCPKLAAEKSYNPDFFSHKIRSAGVWFSNYNALSMVADPLVYLIPVGNDVLRSPTSNPDDERRS